MSRCYDHTTAPTSPVQANSHAPGTRLRIEQMDCPTEEALIRDALSGEPGIHALSFNLIQRVLTVAHEPEALPRIIDIIEKLGLRAQVLTDEPSLTPLPANQAKPWWPLLLAGALAFLSEGVHFAELGPFWLSAAFALLAIAVCGLGTFKKGWIALKNRNLNINALMSVAVTGAALIGQWPEAAMVMVLFSVAEMIEARSLDRARNAIAGLMELAPEQAQVRQADGSWLTTAAQQVQVGDVLRVRPGERIALDGVITKGASAINQAPITGESLPVDKTLGEPVFAGTINGAGELEVRVTAQANHTALARIIEAVEQAQSSKAPTQRFVDQFSRIYTPVVFVFAVLVALVPPLLFAGAWFDWLYRALVLLVVACPCALVISTPVTIVSALAAAARHGVLIKGGVYLENARNLTELALDKTGTLTHGKPVQTDEFTLLAQASLEHRQWAASLAARSDHPVSLAIAQQAEQQALGVLEVSEFSALAGRGISGRIAEQLLYLGNHRLVEELGLCSAVIEEQLQMLERQGKSVVVLCDQSRALHVFAVADTVRDNSREALRQLHELGVRTVMLSGDNAHTAAAIAEQVGVEQAHGNLLPQDKLQWVEQARTQGQVVGMVGDGINDAPALAAAHIGFAMGAVGSDTAIETADVALMDDDLRKIPWFVHLSRRTAWVLKQNIALALGIKALFIVLTLSGEASLWMAVFADTGVSLLVVLNGLRLLRS